MPGKRLNYKDDEHGLAGSIYIAGNFTTNGASNPTVFSNGPFTVTRSAAGEITITLKENFSEILACIPKIGPTATANNDAVYPKTYNVGTQILAASVVLETQTVAGTAGDLTGIPISFIIIARKGSLRK